jgi:hypothetical protein
VECLDRCEERSDRGVELDTNEVLAQAREAWLNLDQLVGMPVQGGRVATGDFVDLPGSGLAVGEQAFQEAVRMMVACCRDDEL